MKVVPTKSPQSVPVNGDRRFIDECEYVYYDDYWIRYYEPLADTLVNRKRLIDSLTRRAFHHTEAGINTPGQHLNIARQAYHQEKDPECKRVNAAMLAGALFNRATDLFTSIVNLGGLGVEVSHNNELMRECSDCFEEALDLGRQVKHHSGCEGIDEVWGEPFKAFTMEIPNFYQSRFVKIAQSMRDIDKVATCMVECFCAHEPFNGLQKMVIDYAQAARQVAETMKTDAVNFSVWPKFVALGERISRYNPRLPEDAEQIRRMRVAYGRNLVHEGQKIISFVASARVAMPHRTQAYIEKCHRYNRALLS